MQRRAVHARRRAFLAAAAASVPLAVARPAIATTDVYSSTNGNWSEGFRWTLNRPPLPGEDAQLTNGPGGAFGFVIVNLDTNAPSLASLAIEGTNVAFVTLQQLANSLSVNGSEYIGLSTGGRGDLELGGGPHSVLGTGTDGLFVGFAPGSIGTVNLFGSGALNVSGGEFIGRSGSATFTQCSGNNNTPLLAVASGNLGAGTYNLQGGFLTSGQTRIGDAAGAIGTFSHSGGTHTLSGDLVLGGSSATSQGFYTLSISGLLSATANAIVGDLGFGTFTQNGGSATIGNLFVGNQASGNGTHSINTGTFTASNIAYVGYSGVGTLNISGGTFTAGTFGVGTNFSSTTLVVGNNAGSTGTVNLSSNGTFRSQNSLTLVGEFGNGTFNQTGTNFSNLLWLARQFG